MLNVILSGGIYHPFEETSAELARLWAQLGVETLVTEDVDEAIEALDDADVFSLNALRWRMLDDDKYIPFREEWAYTLPQEHAAAIAGFVGNGGALLALHTASICFDTWPGFKDVLGGVWQWGRSFHPPLGPVQVRGVGSHELGAKSLAFRCNDEIYHHLDIGTDSSVLLEGCVPEGDWFPISWLQSFGAGRVVYDGLGHDAASLKQKEHRAFLVRCCRWLLAAKR